MLSVLPIWPDGVYHILCVESERGRVCRVAYRDISYLFTLGEKLVRSGRIINGGIGASADDRGGVGGVDYSVGFYFRDIVCFI